MAQKGISHPGPLTFGERAHALVIGVVHVVLHQSSWTVHRAATGTSCSGRSVAYLISLSAAVGFGIAVVGQAKCVVQTEIVSEFVGQGLVEVVIVEQVVFLTDPEYPAVQDNPIIEPTHWGQISKTKRGHPAIQAGNNPEVDVVFLGPIGKGLQVVLR